MNIKKDVKRKTTERKKSNEKKNERRKREKWICDAFIERLNQQENELKRKPLQAQPLWLPWLAQLTNEIQQEIEIFLFFFLKCDNISIHSKW